MNYILTKEFINEFNQVLVFDEIFRYQKLNEDILEYIILLRDQNLDQRMWSIISRYQILSEFFIKKYCKKLNWNLICECQKLSENFMRELQDKLNWSNVSEFQVLSEKFIEEFQDKLYWNFISKYQILSRSFIEKLINNINFYRLSQNKNLTNEIIEFFKDKMDFEVILIESRISDEDKLRYCLFMKISKFKDCELKDKIKIIKKVYKEKRILTQEEVEAGFIMEKLLSN